MEDFIYYGLFLTKDTRDFLIDYLKNSDYNEFFTNLNTIHLSHCTLLHVSQINQNQANDVKKRLDANIGKFANMKLTSIGISDNAMAFKVATAVVSLNKNPHITIGTFGNGKPVDSNKIETWYSIDPFIISGFVKKVEYNKKKNEI